MRRMNLNRRLQSSARRRFSGLKSTVHIVIPAILLGLGMLSADVPHLISYQGRLTDGAGTPLTGPHNITFRLYEGEFDPVGAAIWIETQMAVPLNSEGLYNVMLGDVTPFLAPVNFSRQYWLGVEADGGGEICRYQLGASPYALNIASLGAADGQVIKWNLGSGAWVPANDETGAGVGGSGIDNYIPRWNGTSSLENSVIYQTDGGDVGIGTTSPSGKLDINYSGGAINPGIMLSSPSHTTIDMKSTAADGSTWRLQSSNDGKFQIWKIGGLNAMTCLLYTSPSPRDLSTSRMPSSA